MRIVLRMARPTSGRKGRATNLYLPTELKDAATEHAAKKGKSLSELVTRLIRREIRASDKKEGQS